MVYLLGLSDLCDERASMLDKDRDRKATDEYKLQRQKSKHVSSTPLQHHYGLSSQQPDVSPELCLEFYRRDVLVTAEQAQAIERATQQQSDSPDWYRQCRLRVTASNFGKIARRRDSTPVGNLIKSLLYSKPVNAPSLRWGTQHPNMMLGKPTCRR